MKATSARLLRGSGYGQWWLREVALGSGASGDWRGQGRRAVVTRALHRGAADSFVAKEWAGKVRGSGSEGDTQRRGRGVRSAADTRS
jgi:hypothetical protein